MKVFRIQEALHIDRWHFWRCEVPLLHREHPDKCSCDSRSRVGIRIKLWKWRLKNRSTFHADGHDLVRTNRKPKAIASLGWEFFLVSLHRVG